jgi:hypothetical protein
MPIGDRDALAALAQGGSRALDAYKAQIASSRDANRNMIGAALAKFSSPTTGASTGRAGTPEAYARQLAQYAQQGAAPGQTAMSQTRATDMARGASTDAALTAALAGVNAQRGAFAAEGTRAGTPQSYGSSGGGGGSSSLSEGEYTRLAEGRGSLFAQADLEKFGAQYDDTEEKRRINADIYNRLRKGYINADQALAEYEKFDKGEAATLRDAYTAAGGHDRMRGGMRAELGDRDADLSAAQRESLLGRMHQRGEDFNAWKHGLHENQKRIAGHYDDPNYNRQAYVSLGGSPEFAYGLFPDLQSGDVYDLARDQQNLDLFDQYGTTNLSQIPDASDEARARFDAFAQEAGFAPGTVVKVAKKLGIPYHDVSSLLRNPTGIQDAFDTAQAEGNPDDAWQSYYDWVIANTGDGEDFAMNRNEGLAALELYRPAFEALGASTTGG